MRRSSLTAAFAITTALAALPAAAQTSPAAAGAPAAKPASTPTATTTPAPAAAAPARPTTAVAPPTITGGLTPPADYVIGVDDALDIVYWQDKDMSSSAVVRPDGYISLPLVNDVKAAGLTPDQLRVAITEAATKFVEGPTVSVVIKAINSRRVFLTGQVGKPGPYSLMDATTVLQMLAMAGGPAEYAKKDKITIVRRENGKDHIYRFNYKNVMQGKSLEQNILLKPGDTIIVP